MNPLNRALEPLQLTEEEAAELDDLLAHPRALPTVPVRLRPQPVAPDDDAPYVYEGEPF